MSDHLRETIYDISFTKCLFENLREIKQFSINAFLCLLCPPSEGEQVERNLHPTSMMLTSTVNLLQTLCLSAGVHAEVMQSDATRTLCGLLRMLVESGTIDKSGIYSSNLTELCACLVLCCLEGL